MSAHDADIDRLLDIMARLRTPVTGCPWDLEQSFETIAPYTIEEAYEVADAITRGDMIDLKDELGDLLLQVAFHARLAEETDAFRFRDVVAAISDKMVRRHPHVFGDGGAKTPDAVKVTWEEIKSAEKADRAAERGKAGQVVTEPESVLDGVPLPLPALTRAEKIQKKAARVGFDWPDHGGVFAKLDEEIGEIREALDKDDKDAVQDEVGDLLFTVVNLARHLRVDPETALRHANEKFSRRFKAMEKALKTQDRSLAGQSLDALEAAWQAAKSD
ncbi:MAG: nucleoside triphosphate pyrophosphohydrolase [Rhodobiaceae bacterium]|nr:nucleoside triphosphate pyrophosphohydrolase [Rhodobiaceae bacterium]